MRRGRPFPRAHYDGLALQLTERFGGLTAYTRSPATGLWELLTSRFFRDDADPRLIAHFNELQRVSADAETAARYYSALHSRGDGRELYRQVRVPTLVLHCRDDTAVSAEEGRLLASIVPGAQLVMLPSGTHYFPTDADVVVRATAAIERFLAPVCLSATTRQTRRQQGLSPGRTDR